MKISQWNGNILALLFCYLSNYCKSYYTVITVSNTDIADVSHHAGLLSSSCSVWLHLVYNMLQPGSIFYTHIGNETNNLWRHLLDSERSWKLVYRSLWNVKWEFGLVNLWFHPPVNQKVSDLYCNLFKFTFTKSYLSFFGYSTYIVFSA